MNLEGWNFLGREDVELYLFTFKLHPLGSVPIFYLDVLTT